MGKAIAFLVTISILVGVSGCALGDLMSQAPTAPPTPSRTPRPTFTPLPTDTPTPEATPTATSTTVVVPTDTPAPSPTATPTPMNTPIPLPTPTSPPPPPTAIPTHTPTPVVQPCFYVMGSRERSMAGKPGHGQPSAIIQGYIEDGAGNRLNGIGVYLEFRTAVPPTECVISGGAMHEWQPGEFKFDRYASEEGGLGPNVEYYLTIKQSCDAGAPALSRREGNDEFWYGTWGKGHHWNITFVCSF